MREVKANPTQDEIDISEMLAILLAGVDTLFTDITGGLCVGLMFLLLTRHQVA